MYRKIMAPNDGSANSLNATLRAARLARHHHAELRIVRISNPTVLIDVLSVEGDQELHQKAIDDQLAADMRDMEALGRKCRRAGVPTVITALLEGVPGPALKDYAETAGVDLIVMASHSRGELARVVFGSVTDYLIRHCQAPVFVVKDDVAITNPDETIFNRVVVALDGSEMAEKVLPQVAAMATPPYTTVNLVQVLTPATYAQKRIMDPALPWWENEFTKADDYLEHTAAYLRNNGIAVVTDVILADDVAEAILKHAKQYRADLLALTTSGAGGIKRLVLGSIADAIVRKSPVSTLVFHPASSNVKPRLTMSSGATACATT